MQACGPVWSNAAHLAAHLRNLANAEGDRSVAGRRVPGDEHGNFAAGVWASSSRLPATSRREHRPASAECPRNLLMFSLRFAQVEVEKVEKSGLSRMIQSSPKAEVRGSNPFG